MKGVKDRDGIDGFELSPSEPQGFVMDMFDEFIHGKDDRRYEARLLSIGQEFPEEVRRPLAGKDHEARSIVLFNADQMLRHFLNQILRW
jgi:hypothetical protein